MKANEIKAQSAKANNNESNNNVTNNVQATDATATDATATDATATATATDEKEAQEKEAQEKEAQEKEAQRKKAIAAKVEQIKKTTKEIHEKRDVTDFLDTSDKGIATATATKFQTLGKFIAKFQAIEAKDGGKTVYIFESEKDIYIGFTSSELSDIFGLPKREYKSESDKSDSPYLAELKTLQKVIEKITTDDGKKFILSFSEQLKAKIEQVTASEKEKAQFESKFAAVIPLFDIITEAKFAEKHGEENLKIALALGYKFSDTKATDNESNESNESK